MTRDPILSFFAVRNGDGLWFRRKGYSGAGDSWVREFKKARIYTNIGSARAIVGFFSNNKKYAVPEIVEFAARVHRVIDENARIEKKRADAKRQKEKREIREAEGEVAHAQRRLARARENSPRESTAPATGSGG